jgi:hypothetical protein
VRHNLAETLSHPTPLTWSVMRRFMSGAGGFGAMYRMVGFEPSPRAQQEGVLDLVASRVYLDLARASEMFFANFPYRYDLDLLRTMAIVRVPAQASMSFGGEAADFQFRSDLDSLNFSELERGTHFGALGDGTAQRLEVAPSHELAPRDGYFSYEGGVINLARAAVPAMLTLDQHAVRLDCLGYLMQRIGRDGRPAGVAGSMGSAP